MPGARRRTTTLRASDLRGVAQLAVQATGGVTRIAEDVTETVWRTIGLDTPSRSSGKFRGITSLVFDAIHGITQLAGRSADLLFATLLPLLETVQATPDSYPREAVLAALNGVLGDRLAQSANPLAIPMGLRCDGNLLNCSQPIALPRATGKILVLIHGLCMNDLQWDTRHFDGSSVNHGATLAAALGYTPVYLRYNSGLHISTNGRELAQLLQDLVAHWPVAVQEISVVAHSMGGLVIRSAIHIAQTESQPKANWVGLVKNVVFLGTPHHGATLEKAGNWVDVLLGSTPYTKPFARLGQLRSAGITDLRYGHITDADWVGHDRFRRKPDSRLPVPLPSGIAFFAVAATLAAQRSPLSNRILGDGLVPLDSALGQHPDPKRALQFGKSAQWIAYGMGHLELLSRADVGQKMVDWLTPNGASKRP